LVVWNFWDGINATPRAVAQTPFAGEGPAAPGRSRLVFLNAGKKNRRGNVVKKISIQRLFVVAILALSLVATAAHAQTYTDLYNFGSASGDPLNPAYSGIVAQGRDGNLYSTTPAGGSGNLGTVFKITAGGAVSVIYSFDGTHGKVRCPTAG
jgi:uncharacterized repeat protein (TIGR03803 family)